MDIRGAGLVKANPTHLAEIESFVATKYKARISFDGSAGFGRIDEAAGVIHLNPATATFDVLAHELSHVRFAQAVGKWGNGAKLTNFEVNLMESIGYYGTYRKGISSGLSAADAFDNASLGPMFAQQAIQAINSGSPQVMASLRKAIAFYGREYVEAALRFESRGLAAGKTLNLR